MSDLSTTIDIVSRLLLALAAGGAIGIERAFHGRPAGIRTHSLVCVSSTLLMLLTFYQWDLLKDMPLETIRVDPTRMAQGIMTGIGFLGAGVIMKEKLSVRGLTTAASIWMVASIGIIIGMGFYMPAFAATAITLVVLSLFGKIESVMPTRRFGRLMVRFKRSDIISKDELTDIISEYDINAYHPSYSLEDEGRIFQYQMTIYTHKLNNFHALASRLSKMEKISEFSINPTGD